MVALVLQEEEVEVEHLIEGVIELLPLVIILMGALVMVILVTIEEVPITIRPLVDIKVAIKADTDFKGVPLLPIMVLAVVL